MNDDFVALIPVGPGHEEVARTQDLLDSLWFYEPRMPCVLIDDSREPRELQHRFTKGPVVSLLNPRKGRGNGVLGGLCVGILTALSYLKNDPNVRFVVKLDTDSLVINPFSDKIRAALTDPHVGMIGSYEGRDWTAWRKRILNMRRFGLWGSGAVIRSHINAALKNGYDPGEHCLGGSYAIPKTLISRMAQYRYLNDPLPWLNYRMGEDVMIGLYVRAVGLTLKGFVGPGTPFALRWRGLADTPDRLYEAGYGIIHSVKDDKISESTIRTFFRNKRHGLAGW